MILSPRSGQALHPEIGGRLLVVARFPHPRETHTFVEAPSGVSGGHGQVETSPGAISLLREIREAGSAEPPAAPTWVDPKVNDVPPTDNLSEHEAPDRTEIGLLAHNPLHSIGPDLRDVRFTRSYLQRNHLFPDSNRQGKKTRGRVLLEQAGHEVRVRGATGAPIGDDAHHCEGKIPNREMMNEVVRKGGMFSCGWPPPTDASAVSASTAGLYAPPVASAVPASGCVRVRT